METLQTTDPTVYPVQHTKQKPDRSGFRTPTEADLKSIIVGRPYGREGLAWAASRGVLFVKKNWHGHFIYAVTDQTSQVIEARRVDGKPFPPVPNSPLQERKSHALRGSQKTWPVGILEAQDYPAIALMEGIPDFLQAHFQILLEQASHYSKTDVRCAPVGMLASSVGIAGEALPLFTNKMVRIFAHADAAGLKAAEIWSEQLRDANAACVDIFNFSGLKQTDGKPVNDLCDINELDSNEYINDSSLWRIFP